MPAQDQASLKAEVVRLDLELRGDREQLVSSCGARVGNWERLVSSCCGAGGLEKLECSRYGAGDVEKLMSSFGAGS